MMDFATYHKSLLMVCIAACALVSIQPSAAHAKSLASVFDVLAAQENVSTETTDKQTSELQKRRMCMVGAACGGIVGTILILFGYFRLNHATRGFYAGRLQTLAMVLVVVLLCMALWFAQKFGF